ncbi:stage V sporulation protein AD [Tepidanaerobacter acetatoxydans Re1]|uniref:Stage V sporulation protein AD n=1 Tax=Tepidanaerobacter acetatoxydans (strain DSM 21804 / JCM 16047 / Re1) TaxID=1209989 RepID=F4LUZ3_TEPAE|nr:stage V sporulation protein AD [Tepidanaerobacter acetatoxydans]AEE91519.1 stage V sporulation protein AD [Tepidanaerobacter acetatoxydans Re1]CCP26235.1 stage V sporulation protein AD [Tepidanaerobacter acetatoxydans Re1]
MSIKKLGSQTIRFENPPSIIGAASIVGPKEGQGRFKDYYDLILSDNIYAESSWEKAEKKILKETIEIAIKNANLTTTKIEYLIAGDLLNQIISAGFAARELEIPFLGIYGACSTLAEGVTLGSIIVDGGFAENVVAAVSSHFCTAERQFRFPLELGNQRTPTSQWTVTGAGAMVLSSKQQNPRVTFATTGKVIDMGESDSNDMGAAMAPAAIDTIIRHFQDTGKTPDDYDLIITGDLGSIGKEITEELLKQKGYNMSNKYADCGVLIYYPEQDVHAGGSGCACSAVVTCGYIFKEMLKGQYNKVLLIATGALLSTTSSQQGETIPCIAHAISLENL